MARVRRQQDPSISDNADELDGEFSFASLARSGLVRKASDELRGVTEKKKVRAFGPSAFRVSLIVQAGEMFLLTCFAIEIQSRDTVTASKKSRIIELHC